MLSTDLPRFLAWRLANRDLCDELVAACGGLAEAEAAWYEAYEKGIAQDRPRCIAHAELGAACGDVSIAIEAIQSGASVESMRSRYAAAAFRNLGRTTVATTHAVVTAVC